MGSCLRGDEPARVERRLALDDLTARTPGPRKVDTALAVEILVTPHHSCGATLSRAVGEDSLRGGVSEVEVEAAERAVLRVDIGWAGDLRQPPKAVVGVARRLVVGVRKARHSAPARIEDEGR